MKSVDFEKLAKDIAEGLVAARLAAMVGGDGGTCNFDAPQFTFDRSPSAKVRAQYDAAVKAAGLDGFWCSGVFQPRSKNRRFVFGPGCGGQGSSRTRAAEAFTEHLERCGWTNVSTYYQAD